MRLWRPQLSPRSSAQRRFARSHWLRADLVVARPPRKRSVWIWLPPWQQVLQCYDIPLAPDLNKARNVQTLPERRHKCSAPASDELRKNPIIGKFGCCALATSGHAAAPPSSAMNSRRCSFDHLVGAREERRRNVEAERLRGLEIDHQLDLRNLLHR